MKGAAIIALLFSTVPASALYITYSQWVGLPPGERSRYMAGAFDSLVSIADDDRGRSISVHYEQCVARAKMTDRQLADNVIQFAVSRPGLHVGTVQSALIEYLVTACGLPGS